MNGNFKFNYDSHISQQKSFSLAVILCLSCCPSKKNPSDNIVSGRSKLRPRERCKCWHLEPTHWESFGTRERKAFSFEVFPNHIEKGWQIQKHAEVCGRALFAVDCIGGSRTKFNILPCLARSTKKCIWVTHSNNSYQPFMNLKFFSVYESKGLTFFSKGQCQAAWELVNQPHDHHNLIYIPHRQPSEKINWNFTNAMVGGATIWNHNKMEPPRKSLSWLYQHFTICEKLINVPFDTKQSVICF